METSEAEDKSVSDDGATCDLQTLMEQPQIPPIVTSPEKVPIITQRIESMTLDSPPKPTSLINEIIPTPNPKRRVTFELIPTIHIIPSTEPIEMDSLNPESIPEELVEAEILNPIDASETDPMFPDFDTLIPESNPIFPDLETLIPEIVLETLPILKSPTPETIPILETPTPKTIPTVETPTPKTIPTKETPTPKTIPTVETPIPETISIVEALISEILPVVVTPSPEFLPVVKTPIPQVITHTPENTPASEGYIRMDLSTAPPKNTPFDIWNSPQVVPLMSIVFDRPPTPPRQTRPIEPLLSLNLDPAPQNTRPQSSHPDHVPYHLRFHPYNSRPGPNSPGSQLDRGLRVRRPSELPPSRIPRQRPSGRDDQAPEGGM
ncbi:unnamed protein product [Allacma fusca]|uniref:Uncharacterized protein n=1 Tax=Allacma fusca TaxID=39272 RepID=A0A8J2NK30_9HEXA|nr:unnamed protein product [Allacma fusca]